MKKILEALLKFLGSLLVGASLMHWLGNPIDGAQVVLFAMGLTLLTMKLPSKK